MTATTRKDLRQRLGSAGFCNDMILSTTTATGGAAGATLIDTSRAETDDAFTLNQVVILSGTSLGDRRTVSTWVQSTGTLTPTKAFTAQIAASVSYELHRVFPADEKDAALNEALRVAGTRWSDLQEDESLTLASNTYTYALASLSSLVDPDLGIEKVEYDTGASGTGTPWEAIDDDYWSLRNHGGVLTLQLAEIPRVGAKLRLTYRVRPSVFSADTGAGGVLTPDTQALQNYVCYCAAAFLYDDAARSAEQGQREFFQTEAAKFHQMAESFMNADKPQPQNGKVRLWTWGDESGRRSRDWDGRIHIP